MSVNAISTLLPSSGAARPAAAETPASGFSDLVKHLVSHTEGSVQAANQAVSSMLDQSADVHDAMIALQQADLALQFTVQVRNKLVQAYQEIMRMPV
jgi:flagellar hook-basal body complex protein FliE